MEWEGRPGIMNLLRSTKRFNSKKRVSLLEFMSNTGIMYSELGGKGLTIDNADRL